MKKKLIIVRKNLKFMKSSFFYIAYFISCTHLILHSASTTNTCSTNSSTCNNSSNNISVKTLYHPLFTNGSNIIFNHIYPSVNFNHEHDDDHSQGFIYTYYNYEQTCDGKKNIAYVLFGNDTLNFQGSNIKSPDKGDNTTIVNTKSILADYFGFSPNSDFTLYFSPKIIQQTVALRAGFKHKHFWMDINLPFVQTNWKLTNENNNWAYTKIPTDSMQTQTIKKIPELPTYPGASNESKIIINSFAGDLINQYTFDTVTSFNNDGTMDVSYMQSILDNEGDIFPAPEEDVDYKSGGDNYILNETLQKPFVPSLSLQDGLNGKKFGEVEERQNSLFLNNPMCNKKSGLADLHIRAGIDCYSCDSTEIKIYAKAVIPTGTELNNKYIVNLFNPIIGNGHYYELGAGVNIEFEHCICDNSSVSFIFDAYGTHLFKTPTVRVFDLTNKPLSRFALLKELIYLPNNAIEDDGTVLSGEKETALDFPIYAYNQNLIPVCNKNIITAESYVNIYGEILMNILYTCKNWTYGAGYVFTGKSKEEYSNVKTTTKDQLYYGLKGISGLNKIGLKVNSSDKSKIENLVLRQNNDIDIKSTMFEYATDINTKDGYEADQNIKDLLQFPLPNSSGFNNAQILHKLFMSVEYLWAESSFIPSLKLISSISFSPCNYKTVPTWSIGGIFGCSF